MRSVLSFLGIGLTVAVWTSGLEATNTTQSAGGSGGTAFTISCPATKVLVGIRGRHGIYLDRLEGICVDTTSRGTWFGSPTNDGGGGGGSGGGTVYEIRCPSNQAVSGIAGRAANWIDALQITCTPLGKGRVLTGNATTQAYVAGGTGGSPFGPHVCQNNEPGHGFTGRTGSYIDRIALVCEVPTAPLSTPVIATSFNETAVNITFDYTVCNVAEGGTYTFTWTPDPGGIAPLNGGAPDDFVAGLGPGLGYNSNGSLMGPACPTNLADGGGLKPQPPVVVGRSCGGDKSYTLRARVRKDGQTRDRTTTFTARSTGPCPLPPWSAPLCQVCSGPGIPANPVFDYSDKWRGTCELKGANGTNTGICKQDTFCPPGKKKTARDGVWGCEG